MFWHDITQASQRLANSVVMYDEKPVRFSTVGSQDVRVRDIETGGFLELSLNDYRWKDFRILPSLGFVNIPNGLYWLTRYPSRSSTHGLSRNNTQVFEISSGSFFRSEHNFDTIVSNYGKYYSDSIKGKFPSLEEALDYVSMVQPIAVHHDYAIIKANDGTNQFFRHKRHIGSVSSKGLFLGTNSMFFIEEIRERLGIQNIMEV